jgi:hypothetical protein
MDLNERDPALQHRARLAIHVMIVQPLLDFFRVESNTSLKTGVWYSTHLGQGVDVLLRTVERLRNDRGADQLWKAR